MALFGKKKRPVTLEEVLGKISVLVSSKEFAVLESKVNSVAPDKRLELVRSWVATNEDLEVKKLSKLL